MTYRCTDYTRHPSTAITTDGRTHCLTCYGERNPTRHPAEAALAKLHRTDLETGACIECSRGRIYLEFAPCPTMAALAGAQPTEPVSAPASRGVG